MMRGFHQALLYSKGGRWGEKGTFPPVSSRRLFSMVKIIRIKVSTLERWKRLLSRGEVQKVWAEIEAERSRGGED